MQIVVGDITADGETSVTRNLIRLAWFGIVVFIIVLAMAGHGRELFNYNTETDYLGGFVPEASNLLRGEPLSVSFHPPFYSVMIAIVYTFLNDWLSTGLAVSLAASFATLAISLVFLRKLLGAGAAIGSVVALMISPTFIHFSTQATGDVFSLAIHMAAFLTVYIGLERRSTTFYVLAGIVIGVGLLTRTNNIALLGLMLFYLASISLDRPALPAITRLKAVAWVSAGIAVPLAIWFSFAASTGAPLMPTKTHENLALTYFSEKDRISGDARGPLAEQFSSTRDVLTADPARIVRIYLSDFLHTTARLLLRDTILPFPLIALSLICWVAVLLGERRKRTLVIVLLINLATMYMLINFKFYEHRYYLFLLPFVGAAVGHIAESALRNSKAAPIRIGTFAILCFVVGFGAAKGLSESQRLYKLEWSEDAYAAAEFLKTLDIPRDSIVISRKPHIRHYSDRLTGPFPQVAELDQLSAHLTGLGRVSPVYLFYGAPEQRTRPQFAALAQPERLNNPSFELVARGPERGGWFLYRVAGATQSQLD